MAGKRSARLGKWLGKAAVSYALCIAIGHLLSRVPAGRLGLSAASFFHLRMCLMLLGPIYLALIARIVRTILSPARPPQSGKAEPGRGILLAVTALMLFADLSTAQTLSDWSAGAIQGRGLRHLARSQRYSQKSQRFLNRFVPVCCCLFLLEMLTLLSCIVAFAPLSHGVSLFFLLLLALTGLLLLLVPLALTLLAGYRGDRVSHAQKREGEKQQAVQSHQLVLESDPARRKAYLRLPKCLTLLVCPGVFAASALVLALTKDARHLAAVRLLRLPFLALAAALFSLLPLLLYWANCSGTSLVQRIYLAGGRFVYTGYSGSMEERVEFSFSLVRLARYHVGRRAIRLQGQFAKTSQDAYGTRRKDLPNKTLWIPRTFSPEQEQALLAFLQRARSPEGR